MRQQTTSKLTLIETFALAWAAICIFVALFFPASFSILQGSSLTFIERFPTKLEAIPLLQYIGNLTISVLGIFLFSIILISTGAIFLQLAKLNENRGLTFNTYLAQVATSFLVGHWVLASIFMVLAISNHLTTTTVAWSLLTAFLIGIGPAIINFIMPIRKHLIVFSNEQLGRKFSIIQNLSLGIFIISLMYSTSRLGYDANYIYFSDPKLTAISQQIKFFQNDMFVISSFQTGIQFSAIMLVFNDQTARLFSWISGLITILLGLALAEKVGLSNRAKSIFLALILTSTAFVDLLGDAKVDLTSSAITLAAIYWMFAEEHKYNKLLAGFFVGLSIASRPYNIFLVSTFTVTLYVVKMYRNKDNHNKMGIMPLTRNLLWIGTGAFLPLAYHLIANWAVFGNILVMLKNTPNISSQNWQWSFNPGDIWIMRALYPFVVTFLNTSQSIGNISPLFLAFIPTIFFGIVRKTNKQSRVLSEMLIAALATLILWVFLFFTIMEIRYIFFLWIILFIVTANIFAIALDKSKYSFSGVLFFLIFVVLGFTIFRVIYISLDTYSPVDKQGNPQCSGHIFCDYLEPINKQANPGSRVLSLLAYRYYLRTDLFACSTRLSEYDRIREASKQGSEQFWTEAYRQGYSYVAYENNYSVRHLYIDFIPDPTTAPGWMELETLAGGPQAPVAAYHITAHNAPVSQEKVCVKSNGVWVVENMP